MSKKPQIGKRASEGPLGDVSSPGHAAGEKGSAASQCASSECGSFEEEFEVVEEAVELMERGELTLEQCLREYERGLSSLKNCYQLLAEAQKRIEILEGQVGSVAQMSEGPVWKPADELAGDSVASNSATSNSAASNSAASNKATSSKTDEPVKGE